MRFRPANIRVINRRDSRSTTSDAAFSNLEKTERIEKTSPDITNELVDGVVPYQFRGCIKTTSARACRAQQF
jgi:hypothetical protein